MNVGGLDLIKASVSLSADPGRRGYEKTVNFRSSNDLFKSWSPKGIACSTVMTYVVASVCPLKRCSVAGEVAQRLKHLPFKCESLDPKSPEPLKVPSRNGSLSLMPPQKVETGHPQVGLSSKSSHTGELCPGVVGSPSSVN